MIRAGSLHGLRQADGRCRVHLRLPLLVRRRQLCLRSRTQYHLTAPPCSFACGMEYHNPVTCDMVNKWRERNQDDQASIKLVMASSKQVLYLSLSLFTCACTCGCNCNALFFFFFSVSHPTVVPALRSAHGAQRGLQPHDLPQGGRRLWRRVYDSLFHTITHFFFGIVLYWLHFLSRACSCS
jgi:hypothetical protein